MNFESSHRRKNILTGEWILVSPHRAKRPWQGKVENISSEKKLEYDPNCYLCPNNERANGNKNPDYKSTFTFKNDFSALELNIEEFDLDEKELLISKSEKGICRVICFSPRHDLNTC